MKKRYVHPFENMREETRVSFSLVQKLGPIVKSDLTKLSNMTLSTLNRVMIPIEEAKLVIDCGEGDSTGGRRPHLYEVNKEAPLILSISISNEEFRVAIVNLKVEVLAAHSFVGEMGATPISIIEEIKKISDMLLNSISACYDDLAAVGIGSIGNLDIEEGIIKHAPTSVGVWDNVEICRIVENVLDCPAYLDNAANAAVVVEHLFGTGRESQHVAYFHVGKAIRTGVINSGKLIRAINNKDDALGHMIVDINGMNCACGNHGCVEAASSIDAIMNSYRREVEAGAKSSIDKPIDEVTLEDITGAAEFGDELCKKIITNAGIYFGTGLANYISLMNPHTVILSGPVVNKSPMFFKVCTEVAIKKCFVHEDNELVFRRGCRYKDDVVVAGMASIIIENWLESGLV